MCQQPNKHSPSIMYYILNSKSFVTVLISSNKHFSYAITINLEICHIGLHEIYITKWDYTAGYIFKRYDDHIVCRSHIITKELQIQKLSEYHFTVVSVWIYLLPAKKHAWQFFIISQRSRRKLIFYIWRTFIVTIQKELN